MGCAGSKKKEFADRQPVGRNLTKELAQRSANKEIKPSATSSSSSAPASENRLPKDGGETGKDKESKPLIEAREEDLSSQDRQEKAVKKVVDEEALKKAQEEKDRLFAAQAAQQEKLKELQEKRRLMQEAAAEKQRLKEEAIARDKEQLQRLREANAAAEIEQDQKKAEDEAARKKQLEQAAATKLEAEKRVTEEKRCLDDGVGYTKAEFVQYFGEVDGNEKWEYAKPILVQTAQAPDESACQHVVPEIVIEPTPSVTIHGGSLEEDVVKWLEMVSGESKGELSYMEWLKDGKLLCNVVNKIEPNIVARINTQSAPFKQMENITNFIKACRKLGVLEKDVFSTVDLYEEKNPRGVLNCILNLGGVVRHSAPSFTGPYLGKESTNLVQDVAREKIQVCQRSGYRIDIKHQLREAVNCWNQEEVTPEREKSGIASPNSPLSPRSPLSPKSHFRAPPRDRNVLAKAALLPRGQLPPPIAETSTMPTQADCEEDVGPSITIKQGSLEEEVTAWVQAVTGESIGNASVMDWLKDGQVLCRLANKIQPGVIPKINSDTLPFKQMENVTNFIKTCRAFGVLEKDLFATVDLYEGKNPTAVLICINSFGAAVRSVASFQGPFLGVAQNANVKDNARKYYWE